MAEYGDCGPPPNGTATLTQETLGYEWDYEQSAYASQYPAGRVHLTGTTEGGRTNQCPFTAPRAAPWF